MEVESLFFTILSKSSLAQRLKKPFVGLQRLVEVSIDIGIIYDIRLYLYKSDFL